LLTLSPCAPTPWDVDGGPDTWWASCGAYPDGLDNSAGETCTVPEDYRETGPTFCSNDYDYTLKQSATLWFHDHSLVGRCSLSLSNPR